MQINMGFNTSNTIEVIDLIDNLSAEEVITKGALLVEEDTQIIQIVGDYGAEEEMFNGTVVFVPELEGERAEFTLLGWVGDTLFAEAKTAQEMYDFCIGRNLYLCKSNIADAVESVLDKTDDI